MTTLQSGTSKAILAIFLFALLVLFSMSSGREREQQQFPLLSHSKAKMQQYQPLQHIQGWYEQYSFDLNNARRRIREFCMKGNANKVPSCLSEELELEMTYLRIRAQKPKVVWEISPFRGYSSWFILSALKDNAASGDIGHLYSFDIVDFSKSNIPEDLRVFWAFTHGDARQEHNNFPLADYIFLDSMHSKEFGEFFTGILFPRHAGKHVLVSLHDVYNDKMYAGDGKPRNFEHHPPWMPTEEGSWVVTWFAFQNEHCNMWTPAISFPHLNIYAQIAGIRAQYINTPSVHGSASETILDGPNPTVFFELNC